MLWRRACWAAGMVLLVIAGVVLLLQVSVHGAGTAPRACGSAWDAVAGRVRWEQWWAADLSGPGGGRGQLVRTLRCPGAVNARTVTAGGLALGAVALISAGELAAWRARPGLPGPGRRLRLLGTAVTVAGVLLTAGGLTGIALLAADPHAALFLYVSRPVVVLAGLLLLLPAILLVALGYGLRLMAGSLTPAEVTRETP